MAGHEVAQCNLGIMERNFGNKEHAGKHWKITASAGDYDAMQHSRMFLKRGFFRRESIARLWQLTAYNNSFTEMRSKARDKIYES